MAGLAAVLLAACTGVLPPPPRGQTLLPWQAALQDLGPMVTATLPDAAERFHFDERTTVVVTHDPAAAGDVVWSEGQRRGLDAFVQQGGRLLLLGHAASLAAAIGLEPEWPEATTFRWGFDRRALRGQARLGFAVVTGRRPELFAPLRAAAGQEHTFCVTGGEPCAVPLCAWSIGAPQRGEVLARLATWRDGERGAECAPVLVRWRHGRGDVLALGLLPDVTSADAEVQANATAFLRAAVQSLQDGSRGRLVLLTVPYAAPPEPLPARPAFARRDGPNLPLLAHWGWQAPLADGDGTLRSADELTHEVLLPSWLAGADVCELEVHDGSAQPPLVWPARDPLKRPPAWSEPATPWHLGEARRLAAEAHTRGMLLFGAVSPLGAGERTTERLATLRFLARELTDLRRLGGGAFDGLRVQDGWRDEAGTGLAMLQDFHPAALLCGTGELGGDFAGGLRGLDAADGALAGLELAGLSATWRPGFAASAFPLGVLDARAVRCDGAGRGDATAGGGSHADWIVTQANDFVRERAGLGGSLWWRRFAAGSFARDTVAYVHGVSMEPLIAAVAMPLSATGSDGHRAAARALLDEAPAGFGADAAAPAAVHVLQNNWFQLGGSGGALRYDPSGRASFRADEALVLTPAFLRTRLSGARPDLDQATVAAFDLLEPGLAGEGGFARVVRADASAKARLPAAIAAAATPRWPAAVAVEWVAHAGYHELEYQLRSLEGQGIVGISLDGELLACVPWRSDRPPVAGTLPLHVTGSGPRLLQFEALQGGAVAFDRLRIVRRGEVGASPRVLEPGGSLARLEERSQSSLHDERVELVAAADFPGFVWHNEWQVAARGLQVERAFQLPGYRVATAADLRQPFVLRPVDATRPDVVVVPLQLERHDRFAVEDGALVLHGAPTAGSRQRLGFLFVPRAQTAPVQRAALALCGALAQPTPLALGAAGTADLRSDLGLPWSRIVHLDGATTTPVLVQENGWWTLRGTQPAPDGGRWLRVRHEVGDVVRLVAGPAVLARTRPGPGSQHLLALQDPEPGQVTVRIDQPSRLGPPSVVLAQDVDAVRLDGEPWAFHDGRTVFLPDRVGTYRIECETHGGGPLPGVRSTRAPMVLCRYETDRRALVLVTPPAPDRPFELPWTAVLRGPRPTRIVNGEIVAEDVLPHADAMAAAAARAGGTLIRFRSGTTEVFYGD